jgi:glycosyltransferase involved in cell wall biosynthesis
VKGVAKLVACSPVLRTTLKQQLLYPFQLSRVLGNDFVSGQGVRVNSVHFPAHMDAPAWGLSHYALTVLDLIPLVCADLYKATWAGPRFRFARWLELSAIRNASIILCISAHTARDVHHYLGIPWEKLVVTPLGVDASFYSPPDFEGSQDASFNVKERIGIRGDQSDRPIVLYVGGIDPRKNIKVLLSAFAEVLGHYRNVAGAALPLLVMAGRVDREREYPDLLALANSLNLSDHLVMPGYISDQDLLSLYRVSSVFFFPSLYEGFGLPPLEAMAAGLPVVSSDASAMPEVLGEAALFFSPKSPQDGAAKLIEILSNQSLALRLRVEGVERAKQFTWDRTGEATLHGYQRLLSVDEAPGVRVGSGARRVIAN